MSINDKLDEIEGRVSASSLAPWNIVRRNEHVDVEVWASTESGFVCTTGDPHYTTAIQDAEFIAAARQDVPALVNALRAVLALAEEMDERYPHRARRLVRTQDIRTAIEEALR